MWPLSRKENFWQRVGEIVEVDFEASGEMPASAPEEAEGEDMSSAPEVAAGAGLKLNAAAP